MVRIDVTLTRHDVIRSLPRTTFFNTLLDIHGADWLFLPVFDIS